MIISTITPGVWAGSLAIVAFLIQQAGKRASSLAHNEIYRRAVLRGQRVTIDEHRIPVFPPGRLNTLRVEPRHNVISTLSTFVCLIAFVIPLALKYKMVTLVRKPAGVQIFNISRYGARPSDSRRWFKRPFHYSPVVAELRRHDVDNCVRSSGTKITIREQYMRRIGDVQEIVCAGDPDINSTKEIATIEILPIGKLDFGNFTLEKVTFCSRKGAYNYSLCDREAAPGDKTYSPLWRNLTDTKESFVLQSQIRNTGDWGYQVKVRCIEGLFEIQRNNSLWPLTHSGIRVTTTTALNYSQCLFLAREFSTAVASGGAIRLHSLISNLVSDVEEGAGGLIALQRNSALGGVRVAFPIWQIVTLAVTVTAVLAFTVASVAVDRRSQIKCQFNTVNGVSRQVREDVFELDNSYDPQESIEMGLVSAQGKQFIGVLREGEVTSKRDFNSALSGRGNIDQVDNENDQENGSKLETETHEN